MSAVARPPCTPITNEAAPAARSKGAFSFANLMSKSRSNSPAPQAKPKKETVDLAAVYGTEFARAVAADQFLNGGRLEDSIARVQRANDKMARRRAEKLGVPYVPDATAPVRGPNGELFRDVQDETERRGLLRNAYKGMPENSKYNKGMRPEEDSDNTDEDSSASWAHYQPGQPVARRDSARNEFFNSSFAPAPVRRA